MNSTRGGFRSIVDGTWPPTVALVEGMRNPTVAFHLQPLQGSSSESYNSRGGAKKREAAASSSDSQVAKLRMLSESLQNQLKQKTR